MPFQRLVCKSFPATRMEPSKEAPFEVKIYNIRIEGMDLVYPSFLCVNPGPVTAIPTTFGGFMLSTEQGCSGAIRCLMPVLDHTTRLTRRTITFHVQMCKIDVPNLGHKVRRDKMSGNMFRQHSESVSKSVNKSVSRPARQSTCCMFNCSKSYCFSQLCTIHHSSL